MYMYYTHAFDSPKREILEDMSNAVRVTCAGVLTRSRHVAISQKGPVRKQRPLEGRSTGAGVRAFVGRFDRGQVESMCDRKRIDTSAEIEFKANDD